MKVYNDELYHYGVKGMKRRVKKIQPIPELTQDQYHIFRTNPDTTPANNQYHILRTNLEDKQLVKTITPKLTEKQIAIERNRQIREYNKKLGQEVLYKMTNK